MASSLTCNQMQEEAGCCRGDVLVPHYETQKYNTRPMRHPPPPLLLFWPTEVPCPLVPRYCRTAHREEAMSYVRHCITTVTGTFGVTFIKAPVELERCPDLKQGHCGSNKHPVAASVVPPPLLLGARSRADIGAGTHCVTCRAVSCVPNCAPTRGAACCALACIRGHPEEAAPETSILIAGTSDRWDTCIGLCCLAVRVGELLVASSATTRLPRGDLPRYAPFASHSGNTAAYPCGAHAAGQQLADCI
mmetsp:Transcript_108537/g.231785  ORF Transcript_108537/g.231785 Transcript_108537/m.231785 type:complete len:248 (-) Transcript_108537:2083-2826(-)